ncbi:MAG: hypothetical protein LAO08_04245 [Acidobacteriia bacterium]|nr:hypothetical protein [Terriglobia bacterium]
MKTKSEQLFERFLITNKVPFQKVEEVKEKACHRPDYLILVGDLKLMVEVKELTEDESFGVVKDPSSPNILSHSRIIGAHVRDRINRSKKQIRYGADQGIPSILLIYNNIDPIFQVHGTESHDFIAAMYGEITFLIDKNTRKRTDWFHGRNSELQYTKNTSFSAVGHLSDRSGNVSVTLFENIYSKVGVPYDLLPSCFEVKRVEVSNEPLSFILHQPDLPK